MERVRWVEISINVSIYFFIMVFFLIMFLFFIEFFNGIKMVWVKVRFREIYKKGLIVYFYCVMSVKFGFVWISEK